MTNFHYAPIESGLATSTLSDFQDKASGKVRADFGFQSRVRWSLENKQSYMTSLILGMVLILLPINLKNFSIKVTNLSTELSSVDSDLYAA